MVGQGRRRTDLEKSDRGRLGSIAVVIPVS